MLVLRSSVVRLLLGAVVLLLSDVAAFAQQSDTVRKFQAFQHGGRERQYVLHVPQQREADAPLVFVLHGYRGDARDYVSPEMLTLADRHGFAVCYPQGLDDRRGIPHWNARLKISSTDDIGFLSALAGHLQKTHSLSPQKTFTSGISNGGFMSYTLVAERPDVFKAAASVIGTMSGEAWERRESIQPVSILQITAMDDRVVPYDGSMSAAGGWGGAPHQDEILDFWRKRNQTTTEKTTNVTESTTARFSENGIHGTKVWLYQVDGLGHRVPGRDKLGSSTAEVIWEFFSSVMPPAAGPAATSTAEQ